MARRKRKKKKSKAESSEQEQGQRFLVTVGVFALLLVVGIFVVRAFFGG